jgi:hypothetical protein
MAFEKIINENGKFTHLGLILKYSVVFAVAYTG